MSEEKEVAPSEDSIRVVCRFRPLNDTEERTGSKFIVKFPSGTDDQCVSIGVSPVMGTKGLVPLPTYTVPVPTVDVYLGTHRMVMFEFWSVLWFRSMWL